MNSVNSVTVIVNSKIFDEEPNITLKEYIERREMEIEFEKQEKERKLKEKEEKINSLMGKTFAFENASVFTIFHHNQACTINVWGNTELSSSSPTITLIKNENGCPDMKIMTNDKIPADWLFGENVYEIPTKKYEDFINRFSKFQDDFFKLIIDKK